MDNYCVATGRLLSSAPAEDSFSEENTSVSIEGLGLEKNYERIAATTPLGRLCTREDITATAAFLASPDADYITSELIHVTGGTFHQNLGWR